jgi:exopolysaccharide biosynthesis predicted pyruvyltransferase EpsI
MLDLDGLTDTIPDVVDDGSLLTIQPGGNHGDSLIYEGARRFFDDHGIDTIPLRSGRFRDDSPTDPAFTSVAAVYSTLTDRPLRRELAYARHRWNTGIDAVYIHGGGNFNDLWGNGVRCLKAVARHLDAPIVVGPQSFHFPETDPTALFAGVDNDVHLLCRERYSLELMRSATEPLGHVRVASNHDTSLYLDAEDLPVEALTDEYSLIALRRDEESATVLLDEPIDAPVLVRDISVEEPCYEAFVRSAARARKVYTDRLHGAIVATLLGTEVRLYENAYHKNRGVYESSLEPFSTVEFVPDADRP